MRLYQYALLLGVVAVSYIPSACNHAGSRDLTLKNLPEASGSPKILADYQPWFGDPDHIDV